MTLCLFSGEEPNTEEHVIPTWLQKRLNLANQMLYLPNGTRLPYKHAKVPAKSEHNNKFAQIESRISQGIFNPLEIYLWAFKIHLGLLYRDTTLRSDLRDPNAPMIFDGSDFESDTFLFRKLYRTWSNSGRIEPNPFGSVFVVDSLTSHDRFDLIHCLLTGTVAIDIGTKFILVLLWDQGFAAGSNALEMWKEFHVTNVTSLPEGPERDFQAYMVKHAWAAEVAYFAQRHSRSFSTISTDFQVTGSPIRRSRPLEHSDEEFNSVALNFGLECGVNEESGLPAYRKRRAPPGQRT